jgi:hypothetical protein
VRFAIVSRISTRLSIPQTMTEDPAAGQRL